MAKRRTLGWMRVGVGSGVLLQITACFGSDPQFTITALTLNAVISNLVSVLFNTVITA